MTGETSWTLRITILCATFAVVPFIAPIVAPEHPLAALAVRSFFAGLCHQKPARSFILDGLPVAVCVRCLGVYVGAALGSGLSLVKDLRRRVTEAPVKDVLVRRALLGAVSLNAVDAAMESLRIHGNWPWPRFILGILLGLSAGALLCRIPKAGETTAGAT